MDKRFSVNRHEDEFSAHFLRIAEQDWTDWADPREHIYDGYRDAQAIQG